MEAKELLRLALRALNSIPNKRLDFNECKDTYELCALIERHLMEIKK